MIFVWLWIYNDYSKSSSECERDIIEMNSFAKAVIEDSKGYLDDDDFPDLLG